MEGVKIGVNVLFLELVREQKPFRCSVQMNFDCRSLYFVAIAEFTQ